MTQKPEKRLDLGEAGDVFDDSVDDLPQMPPTDDIGWLRTPRSPSRERKNQTQKTPRSTSAGNRKPRKT